MPVINPFQAFVHPQTQKKKKNYPALIVNPQPNFSEFAFFGE
jgi:hypothetical protein